MKNFFIILTLCFLVLGSQAKESADLIWSREYRKPSTGFSITPEIIFLGLPDRVVGVDYLGIQRWSYLTKAEVQVLGGGGESVFAYLADGSVIQLSTEGEVLNLFNVPSAINFPQSLAESGRGYFFGTQNGAAYFYGLTGSRRLSYQTDGYIILTQIHEDGFRLVSDKRIYSFNQSLDLISKSPDHDFIRIAAASEDVVVCATNNRKILLYDNELTLRWSMDTESVVGVLNLKNQSILAGTQGGKVYRLHINGSVLDEFSLPSPVVSADLNENFIVSGTLDNQLFIHTKEGDLMKKISLNSTPHHISMGSDNVIVVTDEGQISYFKIPSYNLHPVLFVFVALFSMALVFFVLIRNW
ncbi:MAG: hypothetical protein GF334_12085 [Candidatus Altiarchaeales archaeon]|nr:hypothetical protein [Candidatus Altiarchaeales archaeon]